MPRLFQAYVMVDWSAASKPTTGPDSIWVGVLKRNVRFQMTFEAFNPPTRKEAEALIDKTLADLAKKGERTLLGFDFPLGFPAGTAAALKLKEPAWEAMLAFIANEVKDKPDNTNNRFQVGAKINRLMTGEAFPFWGCPAKDEQTTLKAKRPRDHGPGDLPELRAAEAATKGPQPIWKLFYQGSVGGQALTGLPVVKRLKDARGARAQIWPFETGWKPLKAADLEDVDVVMAEIYPSITGAKGSAATVKDAAQVQAIAEYFSGLDEAGKLTNLFSAKVGQEGLIESVEREEGWILGV